MLNTPSFVITVKKLNKGVNQAPVIKHTGLYSFGQKELLIFGYTCVNHVMASSFCLPPMSDVTFRSSRGVLVGSRHHLNNLKKTKMWCAGKKTPP